MSEGLKNIEKILVIHQDIELPKFFGYLKNVPEKHLVMVSEGVKEVRSLVERDTPHVILLETKNPAYEFIQHIRTIPAAVDIPLILILPTLPTEIEWANLSGLGVSDYLCKPIQITELKARLQANISLSRSFQELKNQKQTLENLNSQLIESQRQIEAFFDSGTQAYFLIDKRYQVLRFNKIAQNYIHDLMGKAIHLHDEIFPYLFAIDLSSFLESFQKVLKQGKTILEDYPIRQKYMGTAWYQVQMAPAYDLQGEIFGISLSILDVTQRKRTQEKIQKQNEKLVSTNEKLADLIQEQEGLIGIVAHDLKAPLNRLQGLFEIIRDIGTLNEEQENYFKIAELIVKDNKTLIKDILDMHSDESKEHNLQLKQIDVCNFLEDLVQCFKSESERKKIQIHLQYSSQKNVQFFSEPSYLKRILENLLSNAFKFSPLNSNIFIEAVLTHALLQITIIDEGQGISPEDQKKLFKKFQKLSAKPTAGESSTGLGLAITKNLIERLKGEISVSSAVGKGTTFVIRLRNALSISKA